MNQLGHPVLGARVLCYLIVSIYCVLMGGCHPGNSGPITSDKEVERIGRNLKKLEATQRSKQIARVIDYYQMSESQAAAELIITAAKSDDPATKMIIDAAVEFDIIDKLIVEKECTEMGQAKGGQRDR